jgi:glycosyltransferase involved in cell wall biosynthesis
MTLSEAGSIGRLIIASDVPGCNDIVIDNFNGFKYKSIDSEDLFIKMSMMTKLSKKNFIGFSNNSCKHFADNFSSKIVNEKYYKLIQ